MTEKEEKASDKILKELANLKLEIQALKTSKPSEPEHNKPAHATIEEQLACPDCYPKIRDAIVKKEGFKLSIGKRDPYEYPYHCKGCGLNVKKDEKECPSCGTSEAY